MRLTLIISVGILTTSSVSKAEVVFDGGALPEEQGWSVGASTLIPPYPFFTDGDVYDMNTIDAPAQPPGNSLHLWARDVGISVEAGFTIELSLKVIDDTAGHNPFDAPIAFHAHYIPPIADRHQLIYFDEDGIGWGDEADSFALDTTNAFHTYTLTVEPTGRARVFVDGTLALERTEFVTNGTIAFGDNTNDPDLEGHFQLQFIALVPSPPVLAVLLPALGARRRRRPRDRPVRRGDGA